MTRIDKIYLAGFFDGEGTVGLYKDKKQGTWRGVIRITQNYSKSAAALFDEWAIEFGGSVYIARHPRQEITLQLQSQGAVRAFIVHIAPYTVLKTRQLRLLMVWLTDKTYAYRTHQLLKALKREGKR